MENQALQKCDEYQRSILSPRHIEADVNKIDKRIRPIVEASIDSLFTDKPRGLLLLGAVGCGKTSILSIVVKEYMRRYFAENEIPEGHFLNSYINLKFVTHAELISILRSAAAETDGIPPLARYDWKKGIILIDDLGRGYDDSSGWNQTLQDEFFDYRWRNKFPTFMTTNYNKEELLSWPGWERTIDRIADPDWLTAVVVPGDSRRRG